MEGALKSGMSEYLKGSRDLFSYKELRGNKLVPGTGLEPARACTHKVLNLARLPIPPSRHSDLEFVR
jgi:hypothetical protein